MSSIQILKGLGTDAYNNLFDVEIPQVPGVPGVEEVKFRIQTLPIPATPTPNLYTVHYKTQSIEKIGAKFENEFEIVLEVRIDKFQFVYDYFRLWRQLGINQVTGIIDEELVPKIPLVVRSTEAGDKGTGLLYTFQNAYPIRIEGVDFSQENGDPMIRSIAIHYDLIDDTVRG